MRISDICTRDAVHIRAAASVREAAEMMRSRHVGALVVVDQPNGERIPVGMVTDRDIVVSVVAAGVDPVSLAVGDVMTRLPATCGEDEDVFEAIETMCDRGVRRLPVVNAKGGLSGMLSTDDIFGALSAHARELSHALTREQVREMQLRR
jgi:CBS domain-containing protein